MKQKYQVLLLISIFNLFVNVLFAQDLAERKQKAIDGVPIMKKQFGLNDKQSDSLEQLNIQIEEQMDSISKLRVKDRVKGEGRILIFEMREKNLQLLFTKEQYDAYVKFKETSRLKLPPDEPGDWETILRESGKEPIYNP